ncbi:hypothetical protein J8J20_23045, partial [Mycobacterium tuberculosis]|nr:hypothetical protein [Mycobacterium tuberculosis]
MPPSSSGGSNDLERPAVVRGGQPGEPVTQMLHGGPGVGSRGRAVRDPGDQRRGLVAEMHVRT